MPAAMTRGKLFAAVALTAGLAGIALWWRMTSDKPGERSTGPLNVVLITIDTLRADRIGVGLTPAIDTLASRGVVVRHTRTTVPLTLPAHATIMTGLLPPRHGVRENGSSALPAGKTTIASVLKARGYATAAFVGAYVLDRRFGLNAGFDVYDDRIPQRADADVRLDAERPATQVVDAALRWSPPTQPFFLWVHLYDPHAPYTPPAAYLERAHGNAYDGEVAYADAEVARLLSTLDARGLLNDTLIVVAGDHGEALGDHGEQTHGMLLYEKALRVPLIMSGPHLSHRSVDRPATLADIAPTILARAGIAPASSMSGVDLLSNAPSEREVYSETLYPRAAGWSAVHALSSERWKLVQTSAPELYDLSADPDEHDNVASAHAAIVSAMQKTLAPLQEDANPKPAAAAATDEVAERLRALGYVSGSTVPASTAAGAPNPVNVIAAWNDFEDALALVNGGQPARAVTILARLSREHPESRVFQQMYGRASAHAGDLPAALTAYRDAVKRWPRDADLYHGLATVARDAGRRDEAINAEKAALTIDPADAAAHNGLGLLAVDAGKFSDASALFERATALDPTNASYWVNLGNAQRELANITAADGAYRRALDLNPQSADAANGLAVLLVQTGKPAEAVPLLERAVASAPDFYEARLNLGIAYQQAGRPTEAAAAYRDVLKAPARFRNERDAAAKLLASLK
jgi:arylsulfatase A-like enzyme/Flp pilus assembly protein TadD